MAGTIQCFVDVYPQRAQPVITPLACPAGRIQDGVDGARVCFRGGLYDEQRRCVFARSFRNHGDATLVVTPVAMVRVLQEGMQSQGRCRVVCDLAKAADKAGA